MLYVSLGDDNSYCGAQDTVSLRGVILRLDVSRLPAGPGAAPRALVAAPGNPFAASPDSNARLVWAIGLRNPFRFQVDPLDNTLFVDDVGENTWEEMDHVTVGGQDFGWPITEGPAPFLASCPGLDAVAGAAPIYSYNRVGFTSASVGAGVYRRPIGSSAGFPPSYEGDVFMGDYYAGFLRRLKNKAGNWSIADAVAGQSDTLNWASNIAGVSDWLVGPDGGLWYCRQTMDPFLPHSTDGSIGQIHAVGVSVLADTAQIGAVVFLTPRPTPTDGSVQLLYRLPRQARTELSILDALGRRVRRLVRPGQEGPGLIVTHTWDARDDHGRRVRPGLYLAGLSVDGTIHRRNILLLH
jgi:hypothetical protein